MVGEATIPGAMHVTWLAFIASVINSTAWPVTVIVVLLLMRKSLPEIISRAREITLPGVKIVLQEELKQAKELNEEIKAKQPPLPPMDKATLEPEADYLELAQKFPRDAMLQSYASMEKSLRKLNPNAAEMAHYKIHEVALALRDMDFIDNNVLILINRLYTIRNFVAHTERGVTSAEATDFVSMCGTVEAIIAAARARTAGSP